MMDTHSKIEAMLVDRWRAMTPGEKLRLVDDLTETGAALSRAGVKMQFPDASVEEVRLRVFARRLDKELMIKVYGWHPDLGTAL